MTVILYKWLQINSADYDSQPYFSRLVLDVPLVISVVYQWIWMKDLLIFTSTS